MLRLLCLICLLLSVIAANSQCKTSQRSRVMIQTLARVHYAPVANNAEAQQFIALNFFLQIDPSRVLFTQPDIDNTKEFQPYFLDTLSNSNCTFVSHVTALYKERVAKFNTEINQLSAANLNFANSDSIRLSVRGAKSFTTTEENRKKFLERTFKVDVLQMAMEMQEEKDDPETIPAPLSEFIKANESAIKNNTANELLCEVDKAKAFKTDADYEAFLMEALLKAIALAYDPHTAYFDMNTTTSFTGSLSSDTRSYGIIIADNDAHEKVIAGLVPGSDAWRQNTININDKILSVTISGKQITELRCIKADELTSMLDNNTSNRVSIEIEKESGSKQIVQLRKEALRVDENVITGLILTEGATKIGYLSLPAFYTSSSWYIDKGCANDVGKEIMKMNQEGIEGMILDLRNNGGGDMREAVDLAGLFIDVGPICMTVENDGKPAIVKELNKGTIYNGPLIIMVNGFSASASEVFAAVLQDNNRALIVGQRTYGKSTGQGIYPIHNNVKQLETTGTPLAYVKATKFMLYRITGHTHQNKGVQPHVALPNIFEDLDISESNYSNTLKGEFIEKNLVYKKAPDLPTDSLVQRSQMRMQTSAYYKQLNENKALWPKKEYALALNPKVFEKEMDKTNTYTDFINKLEKELKCPFEITAAVANLQVIKVDNYLKSVFDDQSKQLCSDADLHETFYIMKDLIQLQPN
jgi:carboxyl-terminal processing protease